MNNKWILFITITTLFSCSESSTYRNRVVKDINLRLLSAFEYEDGKVMRFTADDSLIYISSDPDNTIKAFDYSGKLIKTIGIKGGAPWENGTIWSFGKDSNCYWIHDYPKMALKKYDSTTDTMQLYRTFITKHNVLYTHNNQFLVPYFDSENGIFYLSCYDAQLDSVIKKIDINKLTKRFNKLPPYGDFTFQGNFCKNNNNQYLFYCEYNGSFFFIDKNIEKTSYHNDVRNLPISEPIYSGENTRMRLDPDNIGIISACMNNEFIYLLCPKNNENKWKAVRDYVIDIYDIKTFKYLYSFNIPNYKEDLPRRIAKTTKGLLIEYKNGYVVLYDDNFIKR